MNKDIIFADIFLHLHHDSLFDDKDRVENELYASSGVYSVHIDANMLRNAMFLSYNPNVVSSEVLLDIIRKSYVRAVKVASMIMTVTSK